MEKRHGRRQVLMGALAAAFGVAGARGARLASAKDTLIAPGDVSPGLPGSGGVLYKSAQNQFVSDCKSTGGISNRVTTNVVRCSYKNFTTTCSFKTSPPTCYDTIL